ncbi:Crp/Fnr family transcriptional regulator [bacterium]|nr:Crp/Fnr family transcriptional regulator [bacterium]
MSGIVSNAQTSAIHKALHACPIFRGLSESDLTLVTSFTVVKQIDKGQYLFRAGDPCHGFYVVQSGAISLHRVHAGGKEQMIHMVRSGESFAEGSLTMDKGYPADARAVVPTTALLVQKNGFVELLRKKPELSLRMLAAMSNHLRDLVQQIEDLTLGDVETRLINWLLKRCPDATSREPVDIDIKVAKRVLASELGTIAETLSRTLAKFRQEGLLEVNGRIIRVFNPFELKEILRQHSGE